MAAPTQTNRNIAIGTPLGKDVLLLKSFSYVEQLGRLYDLDAELLSMQADLDFDKIIGKNVTIRMESDAGNTRYFNGYVARFVQSGSQGSLAQYHAKIVPWLWFLTRRADCRIFQNKTIPEIIKQVFRDTGFTDFKEKLNGKYQPWEYCVQYRETDFNFVSRLMEQEGIYYSFEHAEGIHKLVLSDAPGSHSPGKGCETVIFRPEEGGVRDDEYIHDFRMEQEVQPGAYSLSDFNFERPRTSLFARSQIANSHDQSKHEIFDYPGEYELQSEGTDYSKIRIEELQTQHLIGRGQTTVRGLCAGNTFKLKDFPRADWNKSYLLTSVSIHGSGDTFEGSGGGESGAFFSCSFTVVDAQKQYRPARITPKPLIQGPQTAIVVGPKGEEIHTDKYGRIKVQFHWDRYGKADENSSCWVRVSQAAWAGKKWGSMHIPRIGQEVIVECIEGDPDWPIVTGRVYNADCMPPYDLPAEKTKTTIKSNSSKGGQGFNEFRFEDKKGDEQIYLHAEKNYRIKVKNTTREWMGGNRHLIVKTNQYEKVYGDKHGTVQGDRNGKVVGSDSLIVQADQMTKVSGGHSLTVGGDQQAKVGGKFASDVGQEIHLKAGMKVIIEAGVQITLKGAGGFVDIGPGGVTIQGTLVNINSGGSAGSGSGSSPQAPDVPKLPLEPEPIEGGSNTTVSQTPAKVQKTTTSKAVTDPKAAVLIAAAKSGTPFVEPC